MTFCFHIQINAISFSHERTKSTHTSNLSIFFSALDARYSETLTFPNNLGQSASAVFWLTQ
jgi:hypothetical protein